MDARSHKKSVRVFFSPSSLRHARPEHADLADEFGYAIEKDVDKLDAYTRAEMLAEEMRRRDQGTFRVSGRDVTHIA
ncbi:hypothetical protein HK101_003292 [Irineochytrium annulatum]|nr:hypothetical protein HK101_003292 [Irineochytrium annulatum]